MYHVTISFCFLPQTMCLLSLINWKVKQRQGRWKWIKNVVGSHSKKIEKLNKGKTDEKKKKKLHSSYSGWVWRVNDSWCIQDLDCGVGLLTMDWTSWLWSELADYGVSWLADYEVGWLIPSSSLLFSWIIPKFVWYQFFMDGVGEQIDLGPIKLTHLKYGVGKIPWKSSGGQLIFIRSPRKYWLLYKNTGTST